MHSRFALLLALAAGCGFTDKARERPPDLGPQDGPAPADGPMDSAADVPADGPADAPADLGPDGPPSGWICEAFFYGDGSACDCGCGAADPDCAGQGCAGTTCCDGITCFPTGCDYCGLASFEECAGLTDDCNTGACQASVCVADPQPMGTFCDDGLFCDGNLDECDASGVCVGAASPCPGHDAPPGCDDSCNEATNDCTAADASGTSCNEDGDLVSGTCDGSLVEPNCAGD